MWIPLMEFAIKKGVSLSTLRRHIKSGKIQHKVDHGRYLLFDEHPTHSDQQLQTDLQKAREEIAELRMLVALYEERQRISP